MEGHGSANVAVMHRLRDNFINRVCICLDFSLNSRKSLLTPGISMHSRVSDTQTMCRLASGSAKIDAKCFRWVLNNVRLFPM